VFIQTLIDEEVVPLSGILKGFLLIRDVSSDLLDQIVNLKPCPTQHDFLVVLLYLKTN
jgi:hypothetical protein